MLKTFTRINTLLVICLLTFGVLLTSCDDDEQLPNAGKAELISFGPTGVQHGEEIKFIGRNLNKVEAIELTGATVTKADFVEQTSELIRLIVPEEAMEGLVTLRLSGEEAITSKTVLSFEVPITITSVTSEARPGENISIDGTKLNWVDGVMFDNDTVDSFVSQTPSEIVLQVPSTAKTGTLVILGGGTKPMAIETEEELVVTLPSLTSLSPAAIRHAENLTVAGTDLDLTGKIIFPGGAEVSSFVSQTAEEIVVKVPNSATSGSLTLVAAGSNVEVATTEELNIILPAITSLTSVRHGEILTITGTDLDLIEEITFPGGITASEFDSHSASEIKVIVPDNAENGTLTFNTIHGFEVATSNEFNVILPAVSSFSPLMVDPGANLTINGSNLDLVKTITFAGGTTVNTFESQSATSIVVKVPEQALTGTLELTTIKDFVVTTPELKVVLPAVTGITPTPIVPGAYLTINGSGLDLVKTVVFTGGAEVTEFLAQTENQLILHLPATAQNGVLKLITHRNLEITTTQEVQIGGAPVPTLKHFIFNDAPENGYGAWGGWGGATFDIESTDRARGGDVSIKATYAGDWGGAAQFGSGSLSTVGTESFAFSIYGGEGTDGQQINVIVKSSGGEAAKLVTIVEGTWTDFQIPLSELGNPANITELAFQDAGFSGVVYIDHIGLR